MGRFSAEDHISRNQIDCAAYLGSLSGSLNSSVPEAQRHEPYLTILDMSVTWAGLPPRLSGGGPRRERSGWEDTAMRLKPP
jgi:hypothetical protein